MLDRGLGLAKKAIVIAIMIMMLIAVIVIVVALAGTILELVADETPYIWEKEDFLKFFSFLLLAIIGLELLDTIYVIIKESKIHVETVLLVAVTAVARELIVYDYEKAQGATLIGIATVMIGIAAAYYLVKKVEPVKEPLESTVVPMEATVIPEK